MCLIINHNLSKDNGQQSKKYECDVEMLQDLFC